MDATPFGHYQLQELIGRGGMGEVYRAYDTKTDRVVALKVLPPHLAEDADFQQRFRRESQAAAGINDPHVVPIHGFGEIDGRLYLDMRLIEGRNLGAILGARRRASRSKPGVRGIGDRAGRGGTGRRARAGLIHRDVKPSNILITDRDFAYLIDFGLARTAGEPGLTTAGSTLGTMAYMAPERFEGGHDRSALGRLRADVRALRMPHRRAALSGGQPRAADRRAHRCRRRRGRRPSIRSWRRSTRSSPRAWPRSRASATRRRASWPPPRGAR